MKTIVMMGLFALEALAALSIQAQGTFQNLDFESADLSPVPPNGSPVVYVPVSAGLPGWTAYIGAIQQTQVIQNNFGEGAPQIDILGPNYPAAGPINTPNPGVIDGDYSVLLQSGFLNGITPENASIAQEGMVPTGSESLQFKAWQFSLNNFSVSFNGNNLAPIELGTGANYILYGADISPYAGQTGSLEFTCDFTGTGASWLGLDDIAFSTSDVPEPTTLALIFLGGATLASRRWLTTGK
jgi:hypothetical protein